MLRRSHLVGFVALAAIVGAGWYLLRASQPVRAASREPEAATCEPSGCGAMMGPGPMHGMMKGLSAETMRRAQAVMKMPVFLDSPAAIVGQADKLGLSDEQTQRLTEIENDARKKALAVLTEEQRDKLGEVRDEPITMMAICEKACPDMMPMMHHMLGSKDGDAACPMARGSADDGADEGTTPKEDE
ncbi:MAG: hypothetical protein ACE5O2_16435 [Armatimonadota bacterium]